MNGYTNITNTRAKFNHFELTSFLILNFCSKSLFLTLGNPVSLLSPKEDGMECYRMAERKYKFYLSFEDAICKDYATEKFFALYGGLNLIPVVLGGANYSGTEICSYSDSGWSDNRVQ